jgi:uncharacterized protein YjbI with pentapeptide repeats
VKQKREKFVPKEFDDGDNSAISEPVESSTAPDIRKESSFEKTDFKNLVVEQTQIKGKEFYRSNFQNCKFQGTVFPECRFENSSFADCDLSLVKIINSGLHDVTFFRSKLVGIDWTKANKHMSVGFLFPKRSRYCLV